MMECFIQIICDKPQYFPGDTVNAVARINSKKTIRGDFIQVQVLGREKAIYTSFVDSELNKEYRHEFITHKQRVYTIEGGELPAGEYEIYISFTLP
jgi:hypothetical protein